MALKKSQLYSSLWNSCDKLRGSMDASQYKNYILTLLFVKYISDKYEGEEDAPIEVPKDGGFQAMIQVKNDPEIGDKINKIIARLAESNDLQGVIDTTDFNDEDKLGRGQEMQKKLTGLIGIFQDLDFGANTAEGDDLLGDAYEFLMMKFATESGKSKGQFYTPSEVSQTLAHLLGITKDTSQEKTIYDPACGSGSLLLKAAGESEKGLTIYGQENDRDTWALCRMNMILHDQPTAEISKGDTIGDPYFKDGENLKKFDRCAANPPFSLKSWSNGLSDPTKDPYHRFEYGDLPSGKYGGDWAFLLHILKSLKSDGRGAVILPLGVLFRGGKEQDIRRNIIKAGFIKGIVALPPNLFYGTGIPACIIVLEKKGAAKRKDVFLVDASLGFIKDGNKNRLRAQDMHRIVDVFENEKEEEGYSRKVSLQEIEENDYNLNISRYISSGAGDDIENLGGHIHGGIPEDNIALLDEYWNSFPKLKEKLLEEMKGRSGYYKLRIEEEAVGESVLEDSDFISYKQEVMEHFEAWAKRNKKSLLDVSGDSNPKEIIHSIAEDILDEFKGARLIDEYSVYQIFSDYSNPVLRDDLYLIATLGWQEAAKPTSPAKIGEGDGGKEKFEDPDLVVGAGKSMKKYKMNLLPADIVASSFFSEKVEEAEKLEAEHAAALQARDDFIEENGGEDGDLAEAQNEKGAANKGSLQTRVKEIKALQEERASKAAEKISEDSVSDNSNKTDTPGKETNKASNSKDAEDDVFADELKAIEECLGLFEAETKAKKIAKVARDALNEMVVAKYDDLSEDEIKRLVVEEKWLGTLEGKISEEAVSLGNDLAQKIALLHQDYGRSLLDLDNAISQLEAQLEKDLEDMGGQ